MHARKPNVAAGTIDTADGPVLDIVCSYSTVSSHGPREEQDRHLISRESERGKATTAFLPLSFTISGTGLARTASSGLDTICDRIEAS